MVQSRGNGGRGIAAATPFTPADPRSFFALIAIDLAVFAGLAALMARTGHAGQELALIPTLIAVTASKFFGKKKTEDSIFGNHPAVAFTFRALATGEVEDVDEMVAEGFSAYANGYTVVDPDGSNGPQKFAENIAYWREVVPNLSVDIYDEVSQRQPDKTDAVAVRFVFTGTLVAPEHEHEIEVEAAAFMKVVDKQLTEWRVVVDTAFLDELRSAMGLPLTEEP